MHEQVIQEIEDWLLAEQAIAFEHARSIGLPDSVESLEYVGILDSPTSISYGTRSVRMSPLKHRLLARAFASPDESETSATQARVADLLLHTFGDGCRCWSIYGEGAFDRNPQQWISNTILGPARLSFLGGLASLYPPNVPLARALALDIVAQVEQPNVTVVTMIPVAGLELPSSPLTAGPITVRDLTPVELGALSGHAEPSFDTPQLMSLIFATAGHERLAIEVRSTHEKHRQPDGIDLPRRTLIALQLLGFEPYGRGLSSYWTEPGISLARGGGRVTLPHFGQGRSFAQSDIDSVLRLANLLPRDADTAPHAAHQTVIHRFALGAARGEPRDSLLDYCIALEALFLGGDTTTELSYQLKLRAAFFLRQGVEARRELFRALDRLYKARSKLVHGSGRVEPELLHEAARTGRQIAQEAITRALSSGWPTPEGLQLLILGDGDPSRVTGD